jgi:tetratricopeptide (TPR) repeat protein
MNTSGLSLKKGRKNIYRTCLKNLKRAEVYIIISAIIFSVPVRLFAINRMLDSTELYMKHKYSSAKKKVYSYLEDNPKDALANDMLDMINKTMCSIHLKKAFALLSKEVDSLANKELKLAAKNHADYCKKIEAKYSRYLNELPKEQAANRVIAELLYDPEPSENDVYEITREIRKMLSRAVSKDQLVYLDQLIAKVDLFKEKKRWDEAVELITKFIINNPGNVEAKMLLSEINRLAAEDFYLQAMRYLEKAKLKKGQVKAASSKKYDEKWFEQKVDEVMEEAKSNISTKNDKEAKKLFTIAKHLDPENPDPQIYLDLFEKKKGEFFEESMQLYMQQKYYESTARLNFLTLRDPDDTTARLYYHLSSARKFIKEMKLEKVKEHLIKALQLSPDESEAIKIFDRLQDVMDLISET